METPPDAAADATPVTGRLAGKTALVTGASRGIGHAIALAYLREGAEVIASASSVASLASIASASPLVHPLAADLSSESATSELFADAMAINGQVDILVNNAGIYIGRAFEDYTLAEVEQLMRINVYAVFQLTQLAVSAMKAQGQGKIIQIASTAGKWESPNQAAYNTSKHALVGMSKCVALETAAHGIQVNTLCPGMVETDMFTDFEVHAERAGLTLDELKAAAITRIPQGRFLDPQEIAHLAVYLGSQESDGMTGQTITISGGMRMA